MFWSRVNVSPGARLLFFFQLCLPRYLPEGRFILWLEDAYQSSWDKCSLIHGKSQSVLFCPSTPSRSPDTHPDWKGVGHVSTLKQSLGSPGPNKLTGSVSVKSSTLVAVAVDGNTEPASLKQVHPQMEIRHGRDGGKDAATIDVLYNVLMVEF